MKEKTIFQVIMVFKNGFWRNFAGKKKRFFEIVSEFIVCAARMTDCASSLSDSGNLPGPQEGCLTVV
jgi:hypothetical protein